LNAGGTEALRYAGDFLRRSGIRVVSLPTDDITHLLLDVPAFTPEGTLRSGQDFRQLLADLPENATVIGGKLKHPALNNLPVLDLLEDPDYLSQNAAITAHCAVKAALPRLKVTLSRCPVLVIGWGRIGKCLAQLLRGMGASVTVAARKETDRAILRAMDYGAVDLSQVSEILPECRLLFNTAPEPVLSADQLVHCHPDCVKIELASQNGLAGPDIITARGLPGSHAPESSGKLIADTVLRLIHKEALF